MSKPYDIAVIGSGPGGYVAALQAAQMGASVALVEKDLVGGTCLNRGCIPSKAFLAGAEMLHDLRHRGPGLGLKLDAEPSIDWPTLYEHKEGVLDQQRKGLEFLFKKRNIDLLRGEGVMEKPGRIVVRGGKKNQTVEARHVILATGSRPTRIPGWPVDERVVTSDEALSWQALPESVLIVGGGVIGCEFACFLNEFGVKVAVVEMLSQLVPIMDGALGEALLKIFKKRGVECYLDTKVEELKSTDQAAVATLSNGKTLEVERVLCSIGRRPNTENIGLEDIGVEIDRGAVVVDDTMRTGVADHYAIGDVNARIQLAHSASAMAHVAVENALEGRDRRFEAPSPWCVYTYPEIGGIGLSEEQARDESLPVSIGEFPFAASGKARAWGDSTGFVKVVRHRETDEILGIHALGHAATEFIAAAGILVHTRATAHDVSEMIFAHPTMGEAIHDATEAAMFQAVHLPPGKVARVSV